MNSERHRSDIETAPLEDKIRAELRHLIDGESYFEDFWETLRSFQRLVHRSSEAEILLYRLMGRFEEYADGLLTDDQVMAELEMLSRVPASPHFLGESTSLSAPLALRVPAELTISVGASTTGTALSGSAQARAKVAQGNPFQERIPRQEHVATRRVVVTWSFAAD